MIFAMEPTFVCTKGGLMICILTIIVFLQLSKVENNLSQNAVQTSALGVCLSDSSTNL